MEYSGKQYRRDSWLGALGAALMLAAGLLGMALGFFTVRMSYRQIRPQYRRTRMAVLVGGVIYVATAGALHLWIGSLADWTNTLSPLLGRTETAALIQAQYDRLMPAMLLAYAGMVLLILGGVDEEDRAAAADVLRAHDRVSDPLCADPGHPAAVRRGRLDVGFRAELGLGQRGADALDARKRHLGPRQEQHLRGSMREGTACL